MFSSLLNQGLMHRRQADGIARDQRTLSAAGLYGGNAMIWSQSSPTIMVADSDEDERCLLKSVLELKGFQVLEAIDGQEAIEIAVQKRPDLVLMQLKLPVISGFTAIRRIKKHDGLKDVPIIAISFNNPTSNRNLALAAGCEAHMDNPIEFDLLDALIDRLLPGDRLPLASVLIQ